MEEEGGSGGGSTHTLLRPAVPGSLAADLSHTPHSCPGDTSSEVTNTKDTHTVSNIRATSEGGKIHREAATAKKVWCYWWEFWE